MQKYFRMRMMVSIGLILLTVSSCKKDPDPIDCPTAISNLKINQLKVLGSHNSYKVGPYQPLFEWMLSMNDLSADIDVNELDYTHEPLVTQFDQYGIRQVEIDIHYDPDGGLFYNRKGHQFISEPEESGIPELLQPGMKVLHLADFDYNTHHYTFIDALEEMKGWSDMHPNHLPLFVMIEPKSESVQEALSFLDLTIVLEFTADAMNAIDDEIEQVFGSDLDQVITPDDVRGTYATLNQAVLDKAWPLLEDARGKLIFVMLASSSEKTNYLQGHAGLSDRAMFLFSEAGEPECAFISKDDPVNSFDEIQTLVKDGYIIRTRSDNGTHEARTGDYSQMNSAFSCGAQLISTDYYRPDPRHDTSAVWTDFQVRFPNGELAFVNPVNGYVEDCVLTE